MVPVFETGVFSCLAADAAHDRYRADVLTCSLDGPAGHLDRTLRLERPIGVWPCPSCVPVHLRATPFSLNYLTGLPIAKGEDLNDDSYMVGYPSATDFSRVTAASHPIKVGDPQANALEIINALSKYMDSQVVVFGELSLTGYTCGDLFAQDALLEAALKGLMAVAEASRGTSQLVVVGLPLRAQSILYNVAAAIFDGNILGLVPKQFLANYHEFYEARWFAAADGTEPDSILITRGCESETIPFGIDLLFAWGDLVVGIELCEDLWMPIPPSSRQAAAGANLLLNLSASNELVGKADWREVLVRSQSGRCLAAYAYASNGPTESTTDLVFGGHCLIAENGSILAASQRIGQHDLAWLESSVATADIDLQRLQHDRQVTTSWQQAVKRSVGGFRRIDIQPAIDIHPAVRESQFSDGSQRHVSAHPFVPESGPELDQRCSEIFGIQCAGLAKRVGCLPLDAKLNIGVSGGLDSTLALLVAVKTCQQRGWPATRITAVTMPGFGTSPRTLTAARNLMQLLQVTANEIDIRQLCLDTFYALGHQPFGIAHSSLSLEEFLAALEQVPAGRRHDLVFENVQARVRTMLLMNRGFVVGTGDLSEQALGWSTYNADHMSMYNVNTSIPKTLVKFLVRFVAEHEFDARIRECLLGIVDTPISPELLPLDQDGEIQQRTEEALGAYELHDFFLYHMLRFGAGPRRILQLAKLAQFDTAYTEEVVRETLAVFLRRFFANQFKRSCVPDGPKVGSVSLSPRGDWRMPSDADVSAWLHEVEASG